MAQGQLQLLLKMLQSSQDVSRRLNRNARHASAQKWAAADPGCVLQAENEAVDDSAFVDKNQKNKKKKKRET